MLQDKSALGILSTKRSVFKFFCELNLKIIKQDHAIKKIYCKNSKSTTNLTGAGLNLVRDVKEHLTQVFKGDGY